MAGLWLAGTAVAETPKVTAGGVTARFEDPTNRYGHAIMGNLPEWGKLCLDRAGKTACVTLPKTSVFEDITPRLHDLDGDGTPEAVVVESSFTGGAALVVYQLSDTDFTRIATPPIGTRNRWLAPAGIADLDGDGHIELAYIDRPHLAKRGGLRTCNGAPEIITASANWSRIIASRLENGRITAQDIGSFSAAALKSAMTCR